MAPEGKNNSSSLSILYPELILSGLLLIPSSISCSVGDINKLSNVTLLFSCFISLALSCKTSRASVSSPLFCKLVASSRRAFSFLSCFTTSFLYYNLSTVSSREPLLIPRDLVSSKLKNVLINLSLSIGSSILEAVI